MRKTILLAVLLLSVSCFASNSDFYRINTEPFWDGNVTAGWIGQAQTFQAPAGTAALSDWEFELYGRNTPGQVTFNIYQWGPTGPVGNALFSQNVDWGTQTSTYDVTGINLALDPDLMYAATIDLQGYSGQSVYFQFNQKGYDGHNAWFYNPDYGGWNEADVTNQTFAADFSYAPEPGTLVLAGSSLLMLFGLRHHLA